MIPTEDEILRAIQRRITPKTEYEVVKGLPLVCQHVYTTKWAELEVSNGGFDQYLCNNSGCLAREAVTGFAEIRAVACSKLLDRAISVFLDKPGNQKRFDRSVLWRPQRSPPDQNLESLEEEFLESIRIENTESQRHRLILENQEEARSIL